MTYELVLAPQVQKFLGNLRNEQEVRNIENAMDQISQNPLQGKSLVGQLKGLRSWRVGKYRIIYEILEERVLIHVLRIDLRKKVYK